MLVLSRKKDEQIIVRVPGLEEPITLTIVRIDNRNKVRIGIEAPKKVMVLRSELASASNSVEIDSRAPKGQISAITDSDDQLADN
jgi:carbon storage regulator CsrA